MTRIAKKFVSILVVLTLVTALWSCALADDKVLKIGIAQFAEHPSLDNCREGFIAGMAEAGYTEENVEYVVMNAQADMGLAQQIAQQMSAECDLI
jgi:putative ABC transport system substrate-binding protein